MVKPEIRKLIEQKAKNYSLDPNLIEAFVLQESSGDTQAFRFEPAFFKRYIKPRTDIKDSDKAKFATSWGLMQVMGIVARELGFSGDPLYLCDPATGLEYGCKFLARKRLLYPILTDCIAAYNAGTPRKDQSSGKYRNQRYVDGVLKYWQQIKIKRGEA